MTVFRIQAGEATMKAGFRDTRKHKPAGAIMDRKIKIVVWEEDGAYLGYLQDYPDYWTQGKTRKDLDAHLRDLYEDIASGEISGIRKVEELVIS
jgi:predicted RNase H-like HicB family nuclease